MDETITTTTANYRRGFFRSLLLGLALASPAAFGNEPPPAPAPVETPAPPAPAPTGGGDLGVALRKEREAKAALAEEAKTLRAKLDAIDAEKAKAADAKKAEEGRYQELLAERDSSLTAAQTQNATLQEQLDAIKADMAAREEKAKTRNEEAIKALPEKAQSMVAKFAEGQPADKVADIIAEAREAFGGTTVKHSPAGRTAGGEPIADDKALTPEMTKWFESERPSMLRNGASPAVLRTYYESAVRKAATT